MSWLEDELRKQREQAQEQQRQAQEVERQRAQERQREEALRNQRQQQLDQTARQQLAPIFRSLQLPQLLEDANHHFQGFYRSSLSEDFHAEGNASMLNESLRLTGGWRYSVWLSVTYPMGYYYDAAQGRDDWEVRRTIRIRLWGKTFTQTRIAVEGFSGSAGGYGMSKSMKESVDLQMPTWEEEITSSNTSKIVAQLKDSILQVIRKIDDDVAQST